MAKLTLEEFAKDAGVTIVDCGAEWGGRIGYTEKDRPKSTVCGFKTESSAYKHWMKSTFGDNTSKALMKLLKKV